MSVAPMAPMELPEGWYRLTFDDDRPCWAAVPEAQALAELNAGAGNDLVRKRIITPKEVSVEIRLRGTEAQCAEAARQLGEVFDVVSVSRPYPDRGSQLVRVFVHIRAAGWPS